MVPAEPAAGDWRNRFTRLGAALAATRAYWQPSPFRDIEPAWCTQRPDLLRRLDELGAPAQAVSLAALADLIEEAADIDRLCALPGREVRRTLRRPARADWGIPGRKLAQVEAFVGTMAAPCGELIDWCGGKGHLGRGLANQFDRAVVTLDLDLDLLAKATDLARRARLPRVAATQQDALADEMPALTGKHVVALHACGELHRRLVRDIDRARPAALDLVPCCYGKGIAGDYVPLSRSASLRLTPDDLRLAVTGAATSSAAERARRERAEAWKCGLRRLLADDPVPAAGTHDGAYRALARVPADALTGSFQSFCLALSAREGIALRARSPAVWAAAEAAGWRQAGEIARRNALRLAFARALETWLVLDLAVHLSESGYAVELGVFCAPELTPRNLLLSARRGG